MLKQLVITTVLVEASHANTYARAIAFFSYILFKYDILSPQCCELGGLVGSVLSSRPSALGFASQKDCANVMQCAETWKEMKTDNFFCFKTLHYS